MDNSKQENVNATSRNKNGIEQKSNSIAKQFSIEVPTVSLPKGGGAIKGIDEKFSVNAVNGTSSFSLPIPISGARGFMPSLTLSYNSGSGNGTFGLGWSLGLSSIRRKTEKGLPQYDDAIDSDTFTISEAEDLVAEYQKDIKGNWVKNGEGNFIVNEFPSPDKNFLIRRYKPRLEGLFSRIERWTEASSGYIHWRVISKDNITTIFGYTATCRIANPRDDLKIFEWFPEFTYDDKGNCALYEYKKENGTEIPIAPHNYNRLNGNTAFSNTYLKRLYTGNKTPYNNTDKNFPATSQFMFETLFDYGENDQNNIPFEEIQPSKWPFRKDAFSSYRSGFEIRTCRLCHRVLLYHRFDKFKNGSALVKSLDFEYDDNGMDSFTFLKAATLKGYTQQDDGTYSLKTFPPFSFDYQEYAWNNQINTISQDALINAPAGIYGNNYEFTDLYSEGLSGILTEQGTGWFYKKNLGGGNFTPANPVMQKPSFNGLNRQLQLTELEADGLKQIVNWQSEPKGFFELNDDNEWEPFVAFKSIPNIDFGDPNTRQLDLNGDGLADILITEDNVFRWYPSGGKMGYDSSNTITRIYDEEKGPAIIFADSTESIFLADMSGDGLTDIVRIRNSDVCYWPNLGFGKFGAKVAMDNAPIFDYEDRFNPQYIKLADVDGSGTSDIIYLGRDSFSIWLNRQGNSFTENPTIIDPFPQINRHTKISTTDILGTGLICIVWNSDLPNDTNAPLRYIDLMNSQKPHIMTAYRNNLGKETFLVYTPSTRFYVEDKLALTPWVTKLHFPVYCVSSVTTYDRIRKTRFVSTYSYHHGYYDHAEREFRGFARVDQIDSETIAGYVVDNGVPNNVKENDLDQPPILTRTWFHTGAILKGDNILSQFANEYFKNTFAPEKILPEPVLPARMNADEHRQAFRACKGFMLRKEVCVLDANNKPGDPYITEQHNCLVDLLQPQGGNKYGIFLIHESENITYHYERNPQDPRTQQSFIFEIDDYGNVLSSADVVYPRQINPAPFAEQSQGHVVYTQNSFTNNIQADFDYRAPLPASVVKFEVTLKVPLTAYIGIDELKTGCEAAAVIDYNQPAAATCKRIIEITRSSYLSDDTLVVFGFGIAQSKGLLHQQFKAAFNDNMLDSLLGGKISPLELAGVKTNLTGTDLTNLKDPQGAYNKDKITIEGAPFDYYWLHSGFTGYDAGNFFLPVKYTDAFNQDTNIEYDMPFHLYITKITDAKQNVTSTDQFNFRTLSPLLITDMNGNRSAARYDELGMVIKTFAMGKKGVNEGDNFDNGTDEPSIGDHPGMEMSYTLDNWYKQITTPNFINKADLDTFNYKPNANYVQLTAYETHYFPDQTPRNRMQVSYSYSDGSGRKIMQKVQAKPETLASAPRWIGTGRVILNNKGNPVKQYEPFFSSNPDFEDESDIVQTGVSPIIHYDPLDRVIRTNFPDGTFSRVEFDPWMQIAYDQVDTVTELANQWYIDRHSPAITDKEPVDAPTRAAWLAAIVSGTPTTVYLDTLGHSFLSEQQNKFFSVDDVTKKAVIGGIDKYNTLTEFDIKGNPLRITDAMGNPVMQYSYDMAGNQVFQNGMDAGRRWMLHNAAGKPLHSWDEKQQQFSFFYDELGRPIQSLVSMGGAAGLVFDKLVYGDAPTAPANQNLRGKIYQHNDTAGLLTNDAFDFKGNLLQTSRQLLKKYDEIVPSDLTPDPAITYISSSAYDALNRAWKMVTPDNSVQYHLFNQAGLLESVLFNPQGSIAMTPANESFDALSANITLTKFVTSIDYNEKGQRSRIVYGNNTITTYAYEPQTFRLSTLVTTDQNKANTYQDLTYTYDPVGNITQVSDVAHKPVYFDNGVVKPEMNYTYDAIYRLIQATGREHIGQNQIQENGANQNYRNFPFGSDNLPKPGDVVAMRNYTQKFSYDKVGNILVFDHKGDDGNGYIRNYSYNNASANPGTNNNRLLTTQVAGNALIQYDHDIHGNMTVTGAVAAKKGMPHLSRMDWNFKDELYATAKTVILNGTPETTFYAYDQAGIRVRKVTHAQSNQVNTLGPIKEERIYLQGYEIYRSYDIDGTPLVERQTVHIMDDKSRVALVETKTIGDKTRTDPTDKNRRYIRYQYSNHLGSASLELDEKNQMISYEEYHPYGTTAYQAINPVINPIAKRYRYTGLERDEENGFGYHNARYYVPWLGRWASCDPIGIGDGINIYVYARNNPIRLKDPTGRSGQEPDSHENAGAKNGAEPESPIAAEGHVEKKHENRTVEAAEGTVKGTHATEGVLDLAAQVAKTFFVKRFKTGLFSEVLIPRNLPFKLFEILEPIAHVLKKAGAIAAPLTTAGATLIENKAKTKAGVIADAGLSGAGVGGYIAFVIAIGAAPLLAVEGGVYLYAKYIKKNEKLEKQATIEGHLPFLVHIGIAAIEGNRTYGAELLKELDEGKAPFLWVQEKKLYDKLYPPPKVELRNSDASPGFTATWIYRLPPITIRSRHQRQ
ncbi:SpvB/TcaC N-terminal domain-containing protein [Mucilaginibacter sp.]|uniref:SpvB/TcaC N-terminal domain-containing protein n=1 Tax=Mucilaginibacter sp. TaxID=1882438 RepID=UPI0025DD412D|nr:SpvB/TcaC N-terminal domain-containing protein [Mucilaginibacter sp.]